MLAATSLYGRLTLIERSLNFVKEQTPLPGWMNNFPTYSLWWITIVADYFNRTGAEDFTKDQISYLKELLLQIDDCVSDDGEMHFPAYFLDWPTYNTPDAEEGVRAIAIIATKKASELLERFVEDNTLAEGLYNKLIKKQIVSQSSIRD